MENNTTPLAGKPSPVSDSKVGMIVVSVGLLVVGLIAGYVIGKSGSGDVVYQTATPTAPATTSPTSSPSIPSSWKTYISQHGYEFRYPAEWTLQEGMKNEFTGVTPVTITNQDKRMEFYVEFPASYLMEPSVGGGRLGTSTTIAETVWKSIVFNDGVPGYAPPHDSLYLYTTRGDVRYSITLYPNDNTQLEKTFSPILSTFRFTN